MTRTFIIIIAVAAAALAGCKKQEHTITAGPADPMANVTANAGPIELPPAILASKIYRCKDNSVVYIDWLSDNKSVNLRTEKNGAATQVKTSDEGSPLSGSATAASITYNGKSCKA